MNDDYVKRSDVHKAFQPKYAPAINRTFAAMIDAIPAADVVEVRHGRWEFTQDVDMPWCTKAVCTSCGVPVADNIDLSQSFGRKRFIRYNRYCPDCGAKMDGGQDNV